MGLFPSPVIFCKGGEIIMSRKKKDLEVVLNKNKKDALLSTNIPNYDIYKPYAEYEYDKKKMEEHKIIHDEINRVAMTDIL